MKYGSVCSGIEAVTVAWHDLGFAPSWFSEIEPFPCAVLAHHYPGVPNLGDMALIAARICAGEIDAPDILVGGTPCQAFSIAGLRNGLEDCRGQLTLSFVELANEIDKRRVTCGQPSTIIVWENVPGVLSSKDNAFGCFLGALAGEGMPLEPSGRKWTNAGCVLGPQRTIAWRILDAQYFGLAQRRHRVFVVASARDRCDPTKVLFEFDCVRRDTPPSREAREEVVGTLESHTGTGGWGIDEAYAGYMQPVVVMAFDQNQIGEVRTGDVFNTINTNSNASGRNTPLLCFGGGFEGSVMQSDYQVRRLTPVECSRLQGFPDDYLDINFNGKLAADGPRYKALGNSMAVPVMRWLGSRLQKYL